MCGILGINENNRELVEASARCICYRGPDAHGSFADNLVTLGHNRLSIIDLDSRSTQPMWDTSGEICTIFNGEIYNFKELKAELEQDFEFRTTSDTEVLIYGYKKYGPDFATRLRGMFAYVIYDKREKKIFLFRDHAGIKPLYYYSNEEMFMFASETKAIMKGLGIKKIQPKISKQSIETYFGLGYIPSPSTMYENLYKIPKGSFLTYDLAQNRICDIRKFNSPVAHPNNENEMFDIVKKSIIDHLIADVPVGVFFSGGTDSSLIAAVLHEHGVDLETFSIAVRGRDTDKKYFPTIAAKLGIRAHTYEFNIEEFNKIYSTVMKKVDEPNADISIFPTFFVSKKASERVKIVLSGEGGDELFFGYDRQRALAHMRTAWSKKTSLTLLERIFLYSPTFRGKNYLFQKIFTFFRQPVGAFILFMSPSRDITHPSAWRASKLCILESANDPLYFDRDLYLENDLLRKTDIATMLNSIEGRVPLLDPLVVSGAAYFEKVYSPSSTSKPVLKRMLRHYLPDELVYRPKSGFGMSLPGILPHSHELSRDLDNAVKFLSDRSLMFAKLPKTREELVQRYPNLCFALISLYYAITNNEMLLSGK